MIEWKMTISGKCEEVCEVPKGADIEAINEVFCIGLCVLCDKPILEGDEYITDVKGGLFCNKCQDRIFWDSKCYNYIKK